MKFENGTNSYPPVNQHNHGKSLVFVGKLTTLAIVRRYSTARVSAKARLGFEEPLTQEFLDRWSRAKQGGALGTSQVLGDTFPI